MVGITLAIGEMQAHASGPEDSGPCVQNCLQRWWGFLFHAFCADGSRLLCVLLFASPLPTCAGDATGTILATTSGFVLPFLKLMHCDTMQVFTPRCAKESVNHLTSASTQMACTDEQCRTSAVYYGSVI